MAKKYWKGKRCKLPTITDLKGKHIGNLKVISRVEGERAWMCMCKCFKVLKIDHQRLIHKTHPKTHCGCLKQSINKTHRKEYHTWWDIIARCNKPEHPSYPNFGAKGIQVCAEWQDFHVFVQDMGKCPEDHILRLNEGSLLYAPGMCKWAPKSSKGKAQTKTVTHPKTGEEIKVAALAKELGLTYHQMRAKLIKENNW